MSAENFSALLGAVALIAIVLAVAAAWHLKHAHLTVDEMEQDERSQRRY